MMSGAKLNFPRSAKHAGATMAQRIRLARRRAGLSQAALARRSAVTASAVAQWEHPTGTRPALNHLQTIATVTGVPLEWLVTGGQLRRAISEEWSSSGNAPAVMLDAFAQTIEEENLLRHFRSMSLEARSHFAALAEEFCKHRRRRRLQPD
jgi:transcriptional regulator with XRE-family HTH domain